MDWRRELQDRAAEIAEMQRLGLFVDLAPDAQKQTSIVEDAQDS